MSSVRVNIEEPRFDQSTYWGRAKHFFTVTNPLNLLSSSSQLDEAKDVINRYRLVVGYNQTDLIIIFLFLHQKRRSPTSSDGGSTLAFQEHLRLSPSSRNRRETDYLREDVSPGSIQHVYHGMYAYFLQVKLSYLSSPCDTDM